jgi:hypothetical protein
MRDEQACNLQWDVHDALWIQKRQDNHAVGDQLGRDGEEPEGRLTAALVLVGRVAGGENEAW